MSQYTRKPKSSVLKPSLNQQQIVLSPKQSNHYFPIESNSRYPSIKTRSASRRRYQVIHDKNQATTPTSPKNSYIPSNTLPKAFRSALKSRPITCSPLKKVKFELDSTHLAILSHKTHWKQLFSSIKTNFEKKIQIFSTSYPQKKSYLGVSQINEL